MVKWYSKRLFCMLLVLMTLFSIWTVPCKAETQSTPVPVSHGLAVLSAKTDVALSAMVGNDIVFSADAIKKGLNLKELRFIELHAMPPVTQGSLQIGSSVLESGKMISAENLAQMCFHPACDKISQSSFSFSVNGTGTPIICRLYFLKKENSAPTVSLASGLLLRQNTHKGMDAHGVLSAYDSDGDELIYEIVSYPRNGCLFLTDCNSGSYIYRPNPDFVGSDSFRYVARDQFGNYSGSAKVSLTVEHMGTPVTYADMNGLESYNAALTLTEKNIMSGTRVGNQYYFYPDRKINRADFLVMAMQAAGIRDVPDCLNTGFSDDSEIPAAMKGYVAMAHSLGYIKGENKNGDLCFLPNEPLSRAEAAVILEKILNLKNPPVVPIFSDHNEIPVWAADAIFSLNAAGIFTFGSGAVQPNALLNRAETAELLAGILEFVEK